MNGSALHLTDETRILHVGAGGSLSNDVNANGGQFVQMNLPRMSSGRIVVRFTAGAGDLTLGDGAGNVVLVMGRRWNNAMGLAASWEILGALGMGAAQQIPLKNSAGATPRDFSQIVELTDGYQEIGIVMLGAAQVIAPATTLDVFVSGMVDENMGAM